MEIIKAFGWLILGCFGFAVLFVLSWFVIGMSICFYKIYFKNKVKTKPENCQHASSCYTDQHPDKPWTCHECGELHS